MTHDETTMSSPSLLLYPYSLQIISLVVQYYTQRALSSLFFPEGHPARRVSLRCLSIYMFSSNGCLCPTFVVAEVVVEDYTVMSHGECVLICQNTLLHHQSPYMLFTRVTTITNVALPLACTIKSWPLYRLSVGGLVQGTRLRWALYLAPFVGHKSCSAGPHASPKNVAVAHASACL